MNEDSMKELLTHSRVVLNGDDEARLIKASELTDGNWVWMLHCVDNELAESNFRIGAKEIVRLWVRDALTRCADDVIFSHDDGSIWIDVANIDELDARMNQLARIREACELFSLKDWSPYND